MGKKKKKEKKLVTDEICGQIQQKCNGDPVEYYRAKEIHPSGSIRISNDSVCTMIAIIKFDSDEKIEIKVKPFQQKSVTLFRIKSISIECKHEKHDKHEEHDEHEHHDKHRHVCRGTYALRIHYFLPVHEDDD